MKLAILSLVLSILMMSSLAAAQSLPVPVAGTITTDGWLGGYAVTVTNTRTGETITIYTNEYGQYFLDSWTNHFATPRIQDVFKIEVEDEFQNIIYLGGPIEANFDLDVTCPKCPPVQDCPVCLDCPDCIDCPPCDCDSCCPSCPTCPIDNTPYAECDSCCEISVTLCQAYKDEICEYEPSDLWSDILWLLALVIGLPVGGGIGFTISRWKTGKLHLSVNRHKHEGYSYYHSIFTEHKNYWHPKGVLNPKYKDGKYIGGE